jgi:heat shock protein HtpX
MSFSSYRYGDRLVLRAARARRVTPQEEPRLHNIVEGLSLAAGLPKPEVYVVPERALNAFATGRDPAHSSIAVTQGLLDSMNRLELEGVIAHEMAHIQGRDILLGTIVGTLVGAVVLMAEFMLRIFWWGGGRGRRVGSLPLVLVGFAFAMLSSLFAQLIRVSVSRRREYLADAQGALFTRYPPGLASALKKIAADNTPMKATNNATAHLWLKQPSRVPGEGYNWFETLFSTHPPIGERIRILEEM